MRYSPPDGAYLPECTDPTCDQQKVKCKVCGHYGHPVFYKHDNERMIAEVKHAHFLINKDRGRNVFHKIGSPILCPDEWKVWTWRMVTDPSRWRKIPQEVRHNMGWDNDDEKI